MNFIRTVFRYLFYIFVALGLSTTAVMACDGSKTQRCYKFDRAGKRVYDEKCPCKCLREWINSDGVCVGGVDQYGNYNDGCGCFVDLDYYEKGATPARVKITYRRKKLLKRACKKKKEVKVPCKSK